MDQDNKGKSQRIIELQKAVEREKKLCLESQVSALHNFQVVWCEGKRFFRSTDNLRMQEQLKTLAIDHKMQVSISYLRVALCICYFYDLCVDLFHFRTGVPSARSQRSLWTKSRGPFANEKVHKSGHFIA